MPGRYAMGQREREKAPFGTPSVGFEFDAVGGFSPPHASGLLASPLGV